jgi:hypothetical protein
MKKAGMSVIGSTVVSEMTKKLLVSATGAMTLATDLARHVAWYVSYQAGGRPRDGDSTTRDRT